MQSIYDSSGEVLSRRALDRFMCWDATLPGDMVERIWNDPRALLADGSILQDKIRCTVARLEHAAGPFVWKHHNWGSFRRTLRRSLSRSVARKAWLDGQLLYTAGVPTPRPRAFIEHRVGPFNSCSYYLADYVEGTSLYRLMRYAPPPSEVLQGLAEQVAAIWQQLDGLRVCHNDFKTENLLVGPQGKVWLIDLDRLRRCRRVDEVRRRQIRDAGDLLHPRNWRSDPGAAELFRQEIVKTPAGADALSGPHAARHPLSRPAPATNRPEQLITVLIPCYNAAETIRTCLESIRDMADEILVADAGSTDGTLDVAREFGGCRVIRRSGPEDAEFEAWAHGEATHPWILRLLPCEQLNPELARQVQDMAADKPTEIGFRVARTHFIQGRRLKHGGFERETSIRLYRKDAARYEMRDGRVEVAVDSKTGGRFQPRLFYESCPSIEQWLTELIRQAARFAVSARERGVRPSRWNVLWKAPWQFVKSYVIRGGWLDGWPGLLACCLSAITVVLREAFLWESQQPGAALRSQASGSGETLRIVAPVDRAAGSANADPADAKGAAETTAQQVRRRAA